MLPRRYIVGLVFTGYSAPGEWDICHRSHKLYNRNTTKLAEAITHLIQAKIEGNKKEVVDETSTKKKPRRQLVDLPLIQTTT